MNWKEFKPTIFFLVRFLGIYLVGNILYGWYVTSHEPRPDPVTSLVTFQTAACLNAVGWPTVVEDRETRPTTAILFQGKSIVTVFEGCNGLNVMIIFIAFLVSFGPINRQLFWFVPVGLLIIHISNLLRITFLFFVTLKLPAYLYFSHKYLFTAFIYVFVLLLWMVWVKYFSDRAHGKQ